MFSFSACSLNQIQSPLCQLSPSFARGTLYLPLPQYPLPPWLLLPPLTPALYEASPYQLLPLVPSSKPLLSACCMHGTRLSAIMTETHKARGPLFMSFQDNVGVTCTRRQGRCPGNTKEGLEWWGKGGTSSYRK